MFLFPGNQNGGGGPQAIAFHQEAAAHHFLQAAADIGNADVGMFPQGCVLLGLFHAHPVVLDGHQGPCIGFLCADDHGAAVFPVEDAMLHRVLHQGLQRQRRDEEVLGFNLVDHLELVPKALLL